MYPPCYIKDTLLKDEKLVFTRPHGIICAPRVSALIVAFLFYVYRPSYFLFCSNLFLGGGYALYEICGFIALIIGIYWLISAYFLSDFEIRNNGQAGHYEKGLDLPTIRWKFSCVV
ncbi:hypothetical protein [Candidatus Coxiella mudrowiae]|uniref:hypothetical protein n=1 Tax=Candidatus Coxiella mudrowiae TaxID=2054173 RepID=UPI001F210AA4|nr:hypothetical protein [Candidatus Coxiella mudrowiae]